MSKKDGKDIKRTIIYIRKNASSESAEYSDLQDIFNRRLETSFSSAREISLTEHFKELKEIYSLIKAGWYIDPNYEAYLENDVYYDYFEYQDNPKYPKEDYEDFVVKMLNLKKSVIESIVKSNKFLR